MKHALNGLKHECYLLRQHHRIFNAVDVLPCSLQLFLVDDWDWQREWFVFPLDAVDKLLKQSHIIIIDRLLVVIDVKTMGKRCCSCEIQSLWFIYTLLFYFLLICLFQWFVVVNHLRKDSLLVGKVNVPIVMFAVFLVIFACVMEENDGFLDKRPLPYNLLSLFEWFFVVNNDLYLLVRILFQ